jgi:hypothetical protein
MHEIHEGKKRAKGIDVGGVEQVWIGDARHEASVARDVRSLEMLFGFSISGTMVVSFTASAREWS